MRGNIDAARHVAIDELMVGCVGRTVAVNVRVMVTTAACCRQVMIGAKCPVQHERKRRHDRQAGRQAGRQTPELHVDVTNHPSTNSRCIGEILIADVLPVQRDEGTTRPNCAYLVAFGKIRDSERSKRRV